MESGRRGQRPGHAGRHTGPDGHRAAGLWLDRAGLLRRGLCKRSPRRRSWPRPVICAGSPAHPPWSSTPAWHPGSGCPRPFAGKGPPHRRRPARLTGRRVADQPGMSSATQLGVHRRLQPPHQQGYQPAGADQGADRDRRGDPASAVAVVVSGRARPATPTSPHTAPARQHGRWLRRNRITVTRIRVSSPSAHVLGRGDPSAALRALRGISSLITGRPARRRHNRITR